MDFRIEYFLLFMVKGQGISNLKVTIYKAYNWHFLKLDSSKNFQQY